ncbi:MAG: rRNA pseudouridine synthase [Lachnospiraceae bacterium]|nr:rRNA pseudouridine synthase [Lachnospiraceae bacterium]
MRLDKFLADAGCGSRSDVKNGIRKGLVRVNDIVTKDPRMQVAETDHVLYNGTHVIYERFVYYMLNKPSGVVSATRDRHDKTVLDLLAGENLKDVSPVGRLDKDTEGLLLLTNDGALAHRLLSPSHHVAKKYLVYLDHPVSAEDIAKITAGLPIGDGDVSAPSILSQAEDDDPCHVCLTITEGKYHEVKRIFEAVYNRVLFLKRISMGSLILDESLMPGTYRRLTEVELKELQESSYATK